MPYCRVVHVRIELEVVWIKGVEVGGDSMYALTSIQLSITLALMLVKMSSDCVTSLKRVKSKTTVPYIELVSCVPASPTDAVGMSNLLE